MTLREGHEFGRSAAPVGVGDVVDGTGRVDGHEETARSGRIDRSWAPPRVGYDQGVCETDGDLVLYTGGHGAETLIDRQDHYAVVLRVDRIVADYAADDLAKGQLSENVGRVYQDTKTADVDAL